MLKFFFMNKLCADGEINCIKFSGFFFSEYILHFIIQPDLHSCSYNSIYFKVEHFFWQTIIRNTPPQQSSCMITGFIDLNFMTHPVKMISSRKTGWPSPNHQNFFMSCISYKLNGPLLFYGFITKEPFNCMNIYC